MDPRKCLGHWTASFLNRRIPFKNQDIKYKYALNSCEIILERKEFLI